MNRNNSHEAHDAITEAISMEGCGFGVSSRSQFWVSRAVPRGMHTITIAKEDNNIRHYQLIIIHDIGNRAVVYTSISEAYAGSYIEQAKDDARFASMEACRARTPNATGEEPKVISCVEYEDISGPELKAIMAVVTAAKAFHTIEYAHSVEQNTPTTKQMADLANALEAYEKLQKN